MRTARRAASSRRGAGSARAGALRPERPAGQGRAEVTDDGRIRASLPALTELLDARRPGDRRRAPGPARRASRTRSTRCARSPTGSASCSAARSSSPLDTVGDERPAAGRGLGDGELLLLENVRFNPGETSKDDAERAELRRTRARPAATTTAVLRRRRLRRGAPQARLGLRRGRPAAALLPAGWSRDELEVLRRLTGDAGAALRRRARRLEGHRQARA